MLSTTRLTSKGPNHPRAKTLDVYASLRSFTDCPTEKGTNSRTNWVLASNAANGGDPALKAFANASWVGEFARSSYGILITFLQCPML